MKKVELIKTIGGIIVSVGVGAIVGNTIKSTTPANVGAIKKFCIGVGGFVLTSIVSDKAIEYTEQKITQAVKSVKKMVEKGELEVEPEIKTETVN